MFCQKCGKKVKSDSVFCEFCGKGIKKKEEVSKKKKKLLNKNVLIILFIIVIIFLGLVGYKYLILEKENKIALTEEQKVQKAFERIMQYRLVGYCNKFADSASSLNNSREEWGERCRQEKEREYPPLIEVEVKNVVVDRDKAYIQAILNRDRKEDKYPASYEMIKESGEWKLIFGGK